MFAMHDIESEPMRTVRDHFAHRHLHMVGCAVAAVLVIVAPAVGAPVLVVLGGLMCAVMMIGMIWMMFSMATKGRHWPSHPVP